VSPLPSTRRVREVLAAEGWRGLVRRARGRAAAGRRAARGSEVELPWLPRPAPAPREDVRVDVVVPVYEALEHVRGCLASVERHTDLRRHRLVVVDDASPSEETRSGLGRLVAGLRARGGDAVVLRNETNRGFVHSANRGLGFSGRDVLLLNSDTVVAAGWLDRMIAAAYAHPSVASVTPFSNDATICSVPDFCRHSPLPDGFAADRFAELVARVSPHVLPELPTGVGFCMYMRRDAIERIGPLDEVEFGHGYGEENDWCLKASALGLRHLLEDSTFVYHHGSASFTPEQRERRVRAALEAVDRLWPHYLRMIHDFIEVNPLAGHHELIRWALRESGRGRPERRRVAMVLARPPERRFGGVEQHVADLCAELPAEGWRCVLLHPGDDGRLTCRWESGGEVSTWRFPSGSDGGVERAAEAVAVRDFCLRALEVDVLHVQHVHGLPLEIAGPAAVPRVVSLHDFEFFCRRYDLLEKPEDRFCRYCRDEARCVRCLGWDEPGVRPGDQRARRRLAEELLAGAEAVVAPSRFLAETFRELYPRLREADNLRVVPHGWPGGEARGGRRRPARLRRRRRVGFLGSFHVAKGSRRFAELVERLAGERTLEWWIVGGVEDRASLARARRAAPVSTYGPYRRAELPGLLDRLGIDLVVLPSVWPEAYCYTLTEALLADRPVVAFALGAVEERLRAAGRDEYLVAPEAGAAGLAEAVRRFASSGGAARGGPVEIPDLRATARRYGELYRSALAVSRRTVEQGAVSHSR